jgi:hypothetical protein
MSDIRQHDAEMSRSSPASGRGGRARAPPEPRKPPRRSNLVDLTPSATPTPEPEGRPRRRRVTKPSALQSQDDVDNDGTVSHNHSPIRYHH